MSQESKKSRPMALRSLILLGLLCGSAGLAFFGDKTPSDAIQPMKRPVEKHASFTPVTVAQQPSQDPATSPNSQPVPYLALTPRTQIVQKAKNIQQTASDLFAAKSWAPPPNVPIVVPTKEVAATAPPLPYVFLGKQLDKDSWEVFVSKGESTFIMREGQTLENLYRVEKIAPPTMTLTFLPLGTIQYMPIGEAP